MPQRNNNGGKSSGPYKNQDSKKSSYGSKNTTNRNDRPIKTSFNEDGYRKKTSQSGDSNELTPPRFLPPKGPKSPYARKGPDSSRFNDGSGRSRPPARDARKGPDTDRRSDKPFKESRYPKSESSRPYKSREGSDNDRKSDRYPKSESSRPYKPREGSDNDRRTERYPKSESSRPYKPREGSDNDRRNDRYPKSDSSRPYKSREGSGNDRYKDDRRSDRPTGDSRFSKSDSPRSYRSGDRSDNGGFKKPTDKRNFSSNDGRAPYKKRDEAAGDSPYKKPSFRGSDRNNDKPGFKDRGSFGEKKSYNNREDDNKRSFDKSDAREEKKPFRPKYDPEVKLKRTYTDRKKELLGVTDSPDDIRLNKYIANSGVCSRREADELIKQGLVSVNGTTMTELGYRVKKTDLVRYDGRKILPEPFVYIIMNKPKDFITSTDDDKGRKTVMDLLADKIPQRVYPIGRLDRNTTGVLLLTNDGEVAQALTHPSFQIKKIYHVVLDKKVSGTDLDKLVEGVALEDGQVHADAAAFVDSEDRRHVGIEIHSGKNRVVRRMFEHLGYEVEKLDRVSMGVFTKKDLPRGKWRFLKESEIGFLMKMKANMP